MTIFLSIVLFFIILGSGALIIAYIVERGNQKQKKEMLIEKYGEPAITISSSKAYLFEQHKILVIYGVEYPFESILDFSVNGNQSYRVQTSTGSMLGRGLIGATLFGGIGAIVGANTASKNVTPDSSYHKIHITTKNFSDPVIEFMTTDEDIVNKLTSVLKIIIDQNNLNILNNNGRT